MPRIVADRVRETTVSVGTDAVALAGASERCRPFAAVMAVGDTCHYTIADQAGPDWEVGVGTYEGANVLTRDSILASSNGGARVAFGAGTKDVFLTLAAADVLGSVAITKGGTSVAARRAINLIEGRNVSLTAADNPGAERVDVTIAGLGHLPVLLQTANDFATSSSALVDVTGTGIAVDAGETWEVSVYGLASTTQAFAGLLVALDGPAGLYVGETRVKQAVSSGGTVTDAIAEDILTEKGVAAGSVSFPAINTDYGFVMRWLISPTAAGTVTLKAASEASGAIVRVRAGTRLVAQRIA